MQPFPSSLPVYRLAGARYDRLLCFKRVVVPQLVRKGLAVVTVTPGQPVTVAMSTPSPQVPTVEADGSWRLFLGDSGDGPTEVLKELAARFDLVLVEGGDDLELPAIVVDDTPSPAGRNGVVLGDVCKNSEVAAATLYDHLADRMHGLPVWACILIGGRSSRMGRPKHLLPAGQDGSWLERSWRLVTPHVAGVVVAGGGEVPDAASMLPRVPDVGGMAGPLAGILAALRWRPEVAWLVLACDMPAVDEAAITWLLGQRRPGRWGVVPRLDARHAVEPLLACYEPQARVLFEELAAGSIRRASAIAEFKQITVVEVPAQLHDSWRNVNTPEDLQRFQGGATPGGVSSR